MSQTTILAAGQTAATSDNVSLVAGATVTIGLFVASGDIPNGTEVAIFADTPGADVMIAELTNTKPTTVLSGPGTFRAVRKVLSADVGVYTES